MCVSAYVFRRGEPRAHVSSLGQMAVALECSDADILRFVDEGVRDVVTMRDCLCCLDVEALAYTRGMTCEDPDYSEGTDHFDGWALREDAA